MIKLIVSDMDGTLLNNKSELPSLFETKYRELREKGIRLVIASGRPYENLVALFNHMEHDIIFVSDNGAYIGLDEPIVMSSFHPTDIREMIILGRKNTDVNFLVCGTSHSYIESTDENFIKTLKHHRIPYKYVDDILKIEDEVLKITACHAESWNEENSAPFAVINDSLTVTASAKQWMDIMGKANKGMAVEHLQKHLKISADETMVFGDYLNDIEMLQTTPFSYAMKNAHPDVKKVARFEAPSNDDEGVIKIIEKVVLSQ